MNILPNKFLRIAIKIIFCYINTVIIVKINNLVFRYSKRVLRQGFLVLKCYHFLQFI